MMNDRLSAAALSAKHGDPVARVAADSVTNSPPTTVMSQSSMTLRTSQSLLLIIPICLCLTTGCGLSKSLLGKSKLTDPVLPAQMTASSEMAKADCSAPPMPSRAKELTVLPVAPQAASQPQANVAPVDNGTPQQPAMQQPAMQQPAMQQPAMQQPIAQQQQPYVQPPVVLSAAPQQNTAPLQQPVQPQALQQSVQPLPPVADIAATTQAQGQTAQAQAAQAVPVATASVPEQPQVMTSQTPGLPPATIQAGAPGSKVVIGPELTAAPASAFRAQAHSGSAPAVVCPPGMVPNYGYLVEGVSPPEKLAECEKQVYEMNQKLNELQLDSMKAKLSMEQMAELQKQLLLDNERLRRRAEMADQRYLEELDSLSEIVGEVVSQTGSANKSNSATKSSRGTNPPRSLPQSAAGQSL